jgi:hypothetical protein
MSTVTGDMKMRGYFRKSSLLTGFCLAFLLATNAVASESNKETKIVDGVAIHLGVVPAKTVRGHASGHPESSMHGGVPDKGSNHIVVALFDNATQQSIVNAQVSASVGELGLSSERKTLKVMKINDTISYGNYFIMSQNVNYVIKLSILIPGHNKRIEANFTY